MKRVQGLDDLAAVRDSAREGEEHDEREEYWRMRWAAVVEPGDRIAGALLRELPPEEAFRLAFDDSSRTPPASCEISPREWRAACERWAPRGDEETLVRALRIGRLRRAALVLPGDEAWPRGLDDLGEHAPLSLWVRGQTEPLRAAGRGVSIVGARAATSYGSHVAFELASELARGDVCIVSGAAYGVDGAAHRGALGADGQTLAFLAGGVDRSYPSGHAQLIDAIAERGAVVSEVLPSTAPTRWRFLARNRLIAAIAAATVVVEAGARSGSLNTARSAAALGRPLGAVPGPVTSAASTGCHRLIRDFGAELVASATDVRELLGEVSRASIDEGTRSDPSSGETRTADAMSVSRFRPVAEIARRSGMSERETTAILGLWELGGRAVRSDEGWRLSVPRS